MAYVNEHRYSLDETSRCMGKEKFAIECEVAQFLCELRNL